MKRIAHIILILLISSLPTMTQASYRYKKTQLCASASGHLDLAENISLGSKAIWFVIDHQDLNSSMLMYYLSPTFKIGPVTLSPSFAYAGNWLPEDALMFSPSIVVSITDELNVFSFSDIAFNKNGYSAYHGTYGFSYNVLEWLSLGAKVDHVDADFSAGPTIYLSYSHFGAGFTYFFAEDGHYARFGFDMFF